jgi:septum formation protein
VIEADVEELEEGDPAEVAAENARRKATAIKADRVLGADTVVSLDGQIFGKPGDAAAALQTLRALSGRTHEVIGGVCLLEAGRTRAAIARTRVRFRELDEPLLEWYVASGEWRGRAGGYAIQGRGAALIAGIEGDYLNVVGLPVATLLELAPWLLTDLQV